MPSHKRLRNGYVMVYKYRNQTSQIPEPKRQKPPQAILDALKQIIGIVAYLGRLVG